LVSDGLSQYSDAMNLLQLLAEIEKLGSTRENGSNPIEVATAINPRLEKGVARLRKSEETKESVLVEIVRGRYSVRGHNKDVTAVGTDRNDLVELLKIWARKKHKQLERNKSSKRF
jgi:hypothetical protein